MLDNRVRGYLDTPLTNAARALDRGLLTRGWVTPDRLTLAGLALGLGSAALAAGQWWGWALVAWLASRLLDGLDGALARFRTGSRESGGFLDITADFAVYGAGVVGVAIGVSDNPADLGQWLPFAAVLFAYYLNGAAFLAFSSAAERTGQQLDDGRSFSFLGGLAEGTETIAVHAAWLLLPAYAPQVAAVWAGVVAVSACHRVYAGYRTLNRDHAGHHE